MMIYSLNKDWTWYGPKYYEVSYNIQTAPRTLQMVFRGLHIKSIFNFSITGIPYGKTYYSCTRNYNAR